MKPCIAVLALLMVPLGSPAAQTVIGESTLPERGTRIRILQPGQRREAVLVEWRVDSALARIDATGEFVVIPPQMVAAIEVYDGMRNRAGKGARIGGGIGLGLGLLVVVSAASDEWTAPTAGEAIAAVALSTAVYAGVGAMIGAAVKQPRWRPLGGNAVRLQAGVDPRGRVGVGFRVGF